MPLTISQKNNDVIFPSKGQNYCKFDEVKVLYYLSQKEKVLPYIDSVLKQSIEEFELILVNDGYNEQEVTESLYIVNRMLDNGVKGIDKMYPTFARFNDTKSPNIQTYLAGVYRKTKVPDAFGPLVKMLIKNSISEEKSTVNFDPNEEIGGAILDYLA